jgi:hypothetical protein
MITFMLYIIKGDPSWMKYLLDGENMMRKDILMYDQCEDYNFDY